jgi:hypothetical protein
MVVVAASPLSRPDLDSHGYHLACGEELEFVMTVVRSIRGRPFLVELAMGDTQPALGHLSSLYKVCPKRVQLCCRAPVLYQASVVTAPH